MTTDLKEKYGLLTDAEVELVQARQKNGLSAEDAVASVKADRVGPAALLDDPGPAPNIPGGSIAPPPTQPLAVDGVCPTCGQAVPEERPTGLTAAQYSEKVGVGGATVPELRAASAAAAEEEPETQADLKSDEKSDEKPASKGAK